MDWPEFLERDRYGEVRLKGHRIGLDHVVSALDRGESAEQIAGRFPGLSIELIGQVVAFREANREAVDAYVARCRAEIARQRADSAGGPGLDELRRRKAELASRRA